MVSTDFSLRTWSCLSLCIWLLGVSGCQRGPAVAMVSGSVAIDGVPVEGGQIQFEDLDGISSSAGGKILNGQYELQAAPAQFKVRILAYREVPGKFLELNPGVKTPLIEQYIPTTYNEKSELTAKLTPGRNQVDFTLAGSKQP